MLHVNQTVSHDTLMKEIWGKPVSGKAKILHTNIRRLREKIEKNPADPRYIITVLGLGYKFSANDHVTSGQGL